MRRIDVKITFQCNNYCQFCVQGNKRDRFAPKTLRQIVDFLKKSRAEGYQEVVFTGGEPTVHPDLLKMVSAAKKLGFFTQIQTNGRTFAYKDFCQKLIALGVNQFSPSLHGASAATHDFLTSAPGSFDQVTRGIKNLKDLNQQVITNSVITTSNYKELPQLAELLVSLRVDQFQLAFIHIAGTAAANKDWLVPKKTEIMPFVKKALDIGLKAGVTVMTEAIPYCLMRGYEDYIAEKIIPQAKIMDSDFVLEDYTKYRQSEGKAKGPLCVKCKHYKICEGPWREYPEIFGWDEFKPVKKRSR